MKQFIRANDWSDTSMDVGWGNGYVAIPESSSWHGMKYEDIPVDVHGGLTYADLASNASFKPDGIDDSDWIIGFDTCHYNDDEYSCDKEYVINETNELFKQMVKLDELGFAKMQKTVSCPHCSSIYVLPDIDGIFVETSERITQLEQIAADQARAFKIMADRLKSIEVESKWIIHMTGIERPQLKQLDQSVFDGLDEKWRFAAVDECSEAYIYMSEPMVGTTYFVGGNGTDYRLFGQGYDASNWQNSLIERDTAKELAEVDLSSELTGSELCKAMLARGDKYVMCGVSDVSDLDAASNEYDDLISDAVTDFDNKDGLFGTASMRWTYAVPINNQGEPLTASEAGL